MPNVSSLYRIVAEFDYPICVVDRSGTIRGASPTFADLVHNAPAKLDGGMLEHIDTRVQRGDVFQYEQMLQLIQRADGKPDAKAS